MGGRLGMRRKGLEDLNVYRIQQEREAKVREDLNVQRLLRCLARDRPSRYGAGGMRFFGALRGTGPRTTGCVFFVVRGPVSRDRSLILAILLQTL